MDKKTKKHFVLVHGAWHGAWCYYQMVSLLKKEGHEVSLLDLPGHGIDTTSPSDVTLEAYQNKLTDLLDTLETPVILVGHSMGGVATSSAAENRPDKVEKLVYMAAFLVKNGQSMFDLAKDDTDALVLPNLIPRPDDHLMDLKREQIAEIFYGKSSADTVELARVLLRANPIAPIMTPLTLTANYEKIPRYYVTTQHDKAISPGMQEKMYTAMPCEKVFKINSDHSPFLSEPEKLKEILIEIADS